MICRLHSRDSRKAELERITNVKGQTYGDLLRAEVERQWRLK